MAVRRSASAGEAQHRQWSSAVGYGHALASTEPAAGALAFAAAVALAGPSQAERLATYVVDDAGGDGVRLVAEVRAALTHGQA
jgi:hypothetical protein